MEQPRSHVVRCRLSDEEFEVVVSAATLKGLTPTGYVAQMGVDVARGTITPLPTSIGGVMFELVQATTQLRRYGVLLNQAVAQLNATGQPAGSLPEAVARCETAVLAVREAVVRLPSRPATRS